MSPRPAGMVVSPMTKETPASPWQSLIPILWVEFRSVGFQQDVQPRAGGGSRAEAMAGAYRAFPDRDWRDPTPYRALARLDRSELDWAFAQRHAERRGLTWPRPTLRLARTAPPLRVLTLDPADRLPSAWGLRFRRARPSRWRTPARLLVFRRRCRRAARNRCAGGGQGSRKL